MLLPQPLPRLGVFVYVRARMYMCVRMRAYSNTATDAKNTDNNTTTGTELNDGILLLRRLLQR